MFPSFWREYKALLDTTPVIKQEKLSELDRIIITTIDIPSGYTHIKHPVIITGVKAYKYNREDKWQFPKGDTIIIDINDHIFLKVIDRYTALKKIYHIYEKVEGREELIFQGEVKEYRKVRYY